MNTQPDLHRIKTGTELAHKRIQIGGSVTDNGDVTLHELCFELARRGVNVYPSTVMRALHRLGLSHKKSLLASETQRPDIAAQRDLWINRRRRFFNKALPRLVFIDETSTNTKLTKRTGWSPRGQRYRTTAPFGAWKTQTFIAGLRCYGLTAPWVVNAPFNKQIFELYVETQLAPTLNPGDVVILDNVAFHKSARAEDLVKQRGAWLLFLPPYSPELNPIELAYSKLKTLLRKRAARNFDAICDAVGDIYKLFSHQECLNFFKAAGSKAN